MPTLSQWKILNKLGEPMRGTEGRAVTARDLGKRYAMEMEDLDVPVYVPPVPSVFCFGGRQIDLNKLKELEAAGEDVKTFFPEMVAMARSLVRPGKTADDMTADEIMKRLHDLGWRKEGEAERLNEEKRKREEERRRKEEEETARRRQVLDIVNDPLLKRVKDKNERLYVPKFTRAPESRPCAVCFDYTGPSLAHSTVKLKLDELLDALGEDHEVKVVAIQFQPRAVHAQSKTCGNRWIVTLNSQFAVSQLQGTAVKFGKQEVTLKAYDQVIGSEFETFTKQTNFLTRMFKNSSTGAEGNNFQDVT